MRFFSNRNSRSRSNYQWAVPYLLNRPAEKSLILDVGAYDLTDSIFLAKLFGCSVIAFEADPSNLLKCNQAYELESQEVRQQITIDFRFLGAESRKIEFHSINPEKYGNAQASSRYKLDFSNRLRDDPDYGLTEVQTKVEVQSVRFDDTHYPAPHSIFMDIQGSELDALHGFGKKLDSVQNIVLETSFNNSYIGSSNFFEIDRFMSEVGFIYRKSSRHGSRKPSQKKSSGSFDFDVIYTRENS